MILPKDLGKFPVPECNRQIVFLGSRVPSQALIIPIHSGISDRPDKNPWPLLCRVDCVILHPTIGCFPSSISRQFVLKSHEVTTFESTHQSHLGGGFKYFLFSLPREMLQFDLRIFFRWVGEKPPIRESSSSTLPSSFFFDQQKFRDSLENIPRNRFFYHFTTSKRPSHGTGDIYLLFLA